LNSPLRYLRFLLFKHPRQTKPLTPYRLTHTLTAFLQQFVILVVLLRPRSEIHTIQAGIPPRVCSACAVRLVSIRAAPCLLTSRAPGSACVDHACNNQNEREATHDGPFDPRTTIWLRLLPTVGWAARGRGALPLGTAWPGASRRRSGTPLNAVLLYFDSRHNGALSFRTGPYTNPTRPIKTVPPPGLGRGLQAVTSGRSLYSQMLRSEWWSGTADTTGPVAKG